MTAPMPALFLGHGSPMTVIPDNPARDGFVAMAHRVPRPRAILCISAHWETRNSTHVSIGAQPRTIHDFRGFPPELYAMQYPAPGCEWLVDRIASLLGEERITRDDSWGFDHGVWGVLQPMYPQCDVPTVAMSLNRALDEEGHLAIGRALAPLRDEGVLIVGSGNVIHNIALWVQLRGEEPQWVRDFGHRMIEAIRANDVAALTRFAPDDRAAELLINSGEHYLPLLYVLGARRADDPVSFFNDTIDGALGMLSVCVGEPAPQ